MTTTILNKTSPFLKLLTEQIEYSNVVVLNKCDLVAPSQVEHVQALVSTLNPKATVVAAKHSQIDVSSIVNTGVFDPSHFDIATNGVIGLDGTTTTDDNNTNADAVLDCCRTNSCQSTTTRKTNIYGSLMSTYH